MFLGQLRLKEILKICTFILLSACEVPYKNNARLLVKGEVRDQDGAPIADANISVKVRVGESIFLSDATSTLSTMRTLEDGTFSTIMLFPVDENFAVEVDATPSFIRYQYRTDTRNSHISQNLIDLGLVTLKQNAQLNYNITRVSSNVETFYFRFFFENNACVEFFDDGILNDDLSSCYEYIDWDGTLTDESPDFSSSFVTTLGSEVNFQYSINGLPTVTQTFTINSLEDEFSFTY